MVPCSLALAAVLLSGVEADAPPDALPRVVLPVAESGVADKADEAHPRIIVTIDADGVVSMDERHALLGNDKWAKSAGAKKGNTSVSLERLTQVLFMAREQYVAVARKNGGSGTEKWAVGDIEFEVCRRKVLIRADKDAPWGHVLWVAAVCSETKCWKFQLGVKRHADRAYSAPEAERLGVERTKAAEPDPPALEAKLDVPPSKAFLRLPKARLSVITVTATRSGKDVRFHLGKKTTASVKELRDWLAKEVGKRRDDERRVVVVPEIDTDVPVKFAVAVVEACYRTGAEVYWLDNQVPDMDTRKKAKLPALPTDDR